MVPKTWSTLWLLNDENNTQCSKVTICWLCNAWEIYFKQIQRKVDLQTQFTSRGIFHYFDVRTYFHKDILSVGSTAKKYIMSTSLHVFTLLYIYLCRWSQCHCQKKCFLNYRFLASSKQLYKVVYPELLNLRVSSEIGLGLGLRAQTRVRVKIWDRVRVRWHLFVRVEAVCSGKISLCENCWRQSRMNITTFFNISHNKHVLLYGTCTIFPGKLALTPSVCWVLCIFH